DFKKIGDIASPALALGHFFGRMGCFAAVCCFGRDAHGCSIGIVFPDLSQETGVPIGKLLFPTQLMEAILNLMNFVVLLFLYKKHRTFNGKIFAIYIFNYSLIRFFVEYFRGDSDRGYVFGGMETPFLSLSIPQLISIAGILISVFLYFKFRREMDKEDQ
ncbi:MAG: prolipoprotein diacylglyceryl transferase, partial [Candidatus Aminicenantes bacterium]|nr:prolipoprotein diacylglyceryl transferase [Candidatus Aminicenantes bacterium]